LFFSAEVGQIKTLIYMLINISQTTKDWQIRAFPTYFVIDGEGQIVSRSVGYSTKIGLAARVWMNRD